MAYVPHPFHGNLKAWIWGELNRIASGVAGAVSSIVAGGGIDVDATDPANPIVSVDPNILGATVLTVNDETGALVNSRQELAGTNIEFDDSVPGKRTINALTGGLTVAARWRFSTATTATDPTSGRFKLNNATPASVTAVYISEDTSDNRDAQALFSMLAIGNRFVLQQNDDGTKIILFQVSAAPTDNGDWWTIPVTVVYAGTLYDNNAHCSGAFLLGTAAAGGSNTQVLFNDSGIISGNSAMTFDKTNGRLTLAPTSGNGIQINSAPGSSGMSIATTGTYDANLNLNANGNPWRVYAGGGTLLSAGSFGIYDVTAGAFRYSIDSSSNHVAYVAPSGHAFRLEASNNPGIQWYTTGAGANEKRWRAYGDSAAGGKWTLGTIDDAITAESVALRFTRSGNAVTAMQYGNATGLPSHNFNGQLTATAPSSTGSQIRALASGAGDYAGLRISRTAGTATDWELYCPSGSTSLIIFSGADRITITNAGAVRFNNYGAGTLQTDASGNITAVSDERAKRKIRPFSRGLEALAGIEPILHGYAKSSGLDQTKQDYAGFRAQNVRKFIPEAVGEDPQGMLTLSINPILASLVNATKELNTRISALEAAQ